MNDLKALGGFELSVSQKQLLDSGIDLNEHYSQVQIAVTGKLDQVKLLECIDKVVEKQEVLSYKCRKTPSSVYPYQENSAESPVEYYELTVDKADPGFVLAHVNACIGYPYDPSVNAPFRACLLSLPDGGHILVLRIYALWSDCYGSILFFKELFREYFSGSIGHSGSDMIEYKNFSKWQNDLLCEPDETEKEFWLGQTFDISDRVLPFGRTSGTDFSPAVIAIDVLTGARYRTFKNFASLLHREGSTLLFSLFGAYLSSFGDSVVTVGYLPFKRKFDELDETIGLITRPLPVRFDKKKMFSIADAMRLTDESMNEVLAREDYFQLDLPDNNPHESSFINYCFEYAKIDEGMGSSIDGMCFDLTGVYTVTYSFVVKLFFVERPDKEEITIELYYDKGKLNEAAVHLIASQLKSQFETNRDLSLGLSCQGHRDRSIIESSNNSSADIDTDLGIVDLFERQVSLAPDDIALIFEGNRMTYRELDQRSAGVAHLLSDKYGIGPGDRVAVMLGRSESAVIILLGILRSGAAYVPVDTDYPEDRIVYILKDSLARLLITEDDETRALEIAGTLKVSRALSPQDIGIIQQGKKIDAGSLAYVIYTSGSTGYPKGCMIRHRNLSNYIQWANGYYFKDGDWGNWGLITSLSFDLTVTSLFCALTRGKKLYIGGNNKDISRLLEECFSDPDIDTLKLTPSHLSLLKGLAITGSNIRILICGGEQLTKDQVGAVWHIEKDIRIFNEYGPTETTVGAVVKEIGSDEETILIGMPIANTSISILNETGQAVPVGIPGEIYIGGAGVGAGYLNQPELTQSKFVAYTQGTDQKQYKTGDLGRWMADGNIEYLGRKDDQVKIRGYRIEPGEIETALNKLPGIHSSVVIARTDEKGEKELIAFLLTNASPDMNEVRSQLSKLLPAFMVPHHYLKLDKIPLTANGKIDKNKLLEAYAVRPLSDIDYVAPVSDMEKQLVAVCEDVLKKSPIGMKDNFLALGGDSIKSIQVVSRLRERGFYTTIREMMLYPVLESLIPHIKSIGRVADQGLVEGEVPLGPIQQWFLSTGAGNRDHYNLSVLLAGKRPLAEEGLRAILDKLVRHHDALRMAFYEGADGWRQENKSPGLHPSLEVLQIPDESSFVAECDRIQTDIGLKEGKLANAALFHTKGTDYLLLVVHHLVIDGVSWRILLEDLSTLYSQYLNGKELALPLKTDSFKYWQEALAGYSTGESLKKEEDFWENIESKPVDPLPLDHPGGSNLEGDVSSCSVVLDKQLTELLITKCYSAYHTDANDILVTALCLSLNRAFSLRHILINFEGHGREHIGADLNISRTVGWFTSLYPVSFEIDDRQDIVRQLIRVKEGIRSIPNKGIGYGILRYLTGKHYVLAPQIAFNYWGDFGSGITTDAGADLFEYSGRYHGLNTARDRSRSTILDVSAMIAEGSLKLSFEWSREQFHSSTINCLLDSFRQMVETIIDLLSADGEEHFSPADMIYKGLSIEQLQELNKIS